MILDHYADVRTGDKGEDLMVAVLARSETDYPLIAEQVTESAVAAHYGLSPSSVTRTLMPGISAAVYHLRGILHGGVTGSTYLDGHGKTMGYHVLTLLLKP